MFWKQHSCFYLALAPPSGEDADYKDFTWIEAATFRTSAEEQNVSFLHPEADLSGN